MRHPRPLFIAHDTRFSALVFPHALSSFIPNGQLQLLYLDTCLACSFSGRIDPNGFTWLPFNHGTFSKVDLFFLYCTILVTVCGFLARSTETPYLSALSSVRATKESSRLAFSLALFNQVEFSRNEKKEIQNKTGTREEDTATTCFTRLT